MKIEIQFQQQKGNSVPIKKTRLVADFENVFSGDRSIASERRLQTNKPPVDSKGVYSCNARAHLQIIQRLPHVALSREDNGLQPALVRAVHALRRANRHQTLQHLRAAKCHTFTLRHGVRGA
jgi:hypothetical protein